jgi:predicted aspartyl protease
VRSGSDSEAIREWREFEKDMYCEPIVIPTLVNGISSALAMVDTGCQCYGLCDPSFARKANLKRIGIRPFHMEAFDGEKATRPVREVVMADLDFEGHVERVWLYISPLGGHDIYLGMPWIRKRRVEIEKGGSRLRIGRGPGSIIIRSERAFREETARVSAVRLVSAAAWSITRRRGKGKAQVFAASMADINKALRVKTYTDPAKKLPRDLHKHLDVFSRQESDRLPPLRGRGIDHEIELIRDLNGKEPEVP